MKECYYSTITKKYYDSKEDCLAAEEAVKKVEEEKKALATKRADRAKEVEDAYKAAADAQKKAYELMSDFVADYGSFHTTIKNTDFGPFNSLRDWLFWF